jgi:hypothetical protein
MYFYCKHRKNSVLHYRHLYTATSGEEVCCITDTCTLQPVEKKGAALSIPVLCKQWRRSVLHYRYLYSATSGEEVCCIIDTCTLQPVEKKCAALPNLYSASIGEVCCIIDTCTLQAVEKKCAALSLLVHCKEWRRSVLHYRYLYSASNREVCCIRVNKKNCKTIRSPDNT